MGLADAREKRNAARKVLVRDDDPAETIRLEKLSVTIALSTSLAFHWPVLSPPSTD